jgi:hypothetical protein
MNTDVTQMGEMRNSTKLHSENLKEKITFKTLYRTGN